MNRKLLYIMVMLVLLTTPIGLVSCATQPLPSRVDSMDELRQAARSVQDRAQEMATLRANMAATMIAGAKKEAELQELRALVTQLRQESAESRQALLEANRMMEARQTELAALKSERDQQAMAQAQQGKSEQQLVTLQETVAMLSQDLAQMKETMALSNTKAVVEAVKSNEQKSLPMGSKRQMTERPSGTPLHAEPASGHIVPALHIFREALSLPKPSRITVQPGDSLWSLARRHMITIEMLRSANGMPGDQLMVGQELILP